jgi:hypothetical protein
VALDIPQDCTSICANDTQPPTITCPANIAKSTSTPGAAGAVVTFPNPTASDNCSVVSTVCNPPSGSLFPIGTTTVNCAANDAAGNTASCSFAVTVSSLLVIKDDVTRNFLRLTHNGGATAHYQFFDCQKGVTVSGAARLTTAFCKIQIADNGSDPKKPAPRLSAIINTCTLQGTATVVATGTTYRLNDANVTNNSPGCP